MLLGEIIAPGWRNHSNFNHPRQLKGYPVDSISTPLQFPMSKYDVIIVGGGPRAVLGTGAR